MRHTAEFQQAVQEVRGLLAAERPTCAARLATVLAGVAAGLDSPPMLAAGQVLFEDYAAVRVCVRLMLRVLRRATAAHP
jgi:hypothetical protein